MESESAREAEEAEARNDVWSGVVLETVAEFPETVVAGPLKRAVRLRLEQSASPLVVGLVT